MEESATLLLRINGVTVDFDAGMIRDSTGAEIPLRAQSFAVLRELVRSAGGVVGKDALIETVWKGVAVTDDSLVQCIGEIRKALRDENHAVVRTVRRRGYRFVLPAEGAAIADPGPPRRRRPARLALAATLAGAIALLGLGMAVSRQPAPPAEAPPSIAVLPFDDMSAGGDLQYFGDGVAEDIISMLARSPDVIVMARNSSFVYGGSPVDIREIGRDLGVDYVLEGSVRREGDRLRIVAQLNDARTGQHVWAERFDQAGPDPSALQDEVTGRILSSLTGEVGELKRAQYRAAWGRDTSRLAEYDYFLRGLDVYINAETAEENARGGRIWAEGLAKYPESALLKVKLGWYHWTAAWRFWSGDLDAHFAEARRLASEVLASDNLSPEVRRSATWLNAFVLMQQGRFAEAILAAEETVEMAPYDARVLKSLTDVLIADGEYERALAWLEEAGVRNPARYDPAMRAKILRLMGRNEEAIAAFAGLSDLSPYMHLSAAIAHVRLDQMTEARTRVAEALAIDPAFTRTLWREGSFYSDPAILEAEIADLAAAGLPE